MRISNEFILSVERKFINFMVRAAIGIRKDYFDKAATYKRNCSPICDLFAEPSDSADLCEEVFSGDVDGFENEDLAKAVGKLTPKQKDILFKVVIEQRTEMEVSASLSISQQYVSKAKRKAVKILKSFLEGVE